ncbi:potassium channel protein [candidate division GN15 bacterium]|nr:potassium channel protein [candidate division GN15 bacterium]
MKANIEYSMKCTSLSRARKRTWGVARSRIEEATIIRVAYRITGRWYQAKRTSGLFFFVSAVILLWVRDSAGRVNNNRAASRERPEGGNFLVVSEHDPGTFSSCTMAAYQTTDRLTAAQQLRAALVMALFIITVGTVGFMYLEDWGMLDSLYMTIITLSTVGFGEVRELHDESRLFTIMLIVFGVALGGFVAAAVGQLIIEGQFRELVARRKMEKALKKLDNHFIVAGYGRVGRRVAHEFAKQQVPFVVIEKDDTSVDHLLHEGYLFIQGDATEEDVLHKAGIDTARTLISTLPDEALNVYLTLTARHMRGDLTIIARADFEGGEKKLIRAGANNVVIPHILGGVRMAMAATRPNVVDFVQMTGFANDGLIIEELSLPTDADLDGKSILDSGLKRTYGVTIIGIKKVGERMVINPGPQTVLNSGDILVLIGDREDVERLNRDLRL